MPDPTPHVETSKVYVGDRVNPVIIDITKGRKVAAETANLNCIYLEVFLPSNIYFDKNNC